MGFIYFVGPSLTIDGKVPLPINMDNATALIAICYVLSIAWMIFLPKLVVWAQRIATSVALATAVCLFLPLGDEALRLLIYIQIFCCCFMIGFETFVITNYFTEKSNITYLTIAYGVAVLMIAGIQNEVMPITFPIFRITMVIAIVLLLVFFLRMPVSDDVQPRYVKKSDGLTAPKKLLFSTYILVFVTSLMGVSGPAVSGEITHGISIAYLTDVIMSFAMYILYKKAKVHPFRLIPILIAFGCVGFLLMFVSTEVPLLGYIACALIGAGILSCQMMPLYGAVMMMSYPSKYIPAIIIGEALIAVIVQSSMVEIFRTVPNMLYLAYAVIMVILVLIYMQVEPFFIFTLRRRTYEDAKSIAQMAIEKEKGKDPLDVLTNREREVAELICLGYTNSDIAKVLFISEYTVKDHTKNIYPKLGVHSRLELATLVNKSRSHEE